MTTPTLSISLGATLCAAAVCLLQLGCGQPPVVEPGAMPTALAQVPAVSLNYRYEPDVPAPTEPASPTSSELNPAVLTHFEQTRLQEVLDKTIESPDGKRTLAVYHRETDLPAEFRLDMYTPDGAILRKMTSDLMAVHFPDTIRWSPDSSSVAFVAMLRGQADDPLAVPTPNANPIENPPDADANIDAEPTAEAAPAEPTPPAPTGILTFRTEQIYIANADGENVKPITQSEGLIYFHYVWAADSTALAALAVTQREWQWLNFQAESKGEVFVPVGRPRVVEKNGRERRLDDALTAVHPVWSPDSTKIACAYDTQVRIYDASGTVPTQAAIPLRNQLLMSSQAYDREQAKKLEEFGIPANANQPNANQPVAQNQDQSSATLPDPKALVSFNPIVTLSWPSDDLLYFQTAFIKRMKEEADSVTSFPRWHRLILSPQPAETHR